MKKLDARGIPCPKPIVMTKLALEEDPEVEVMANEEALYDLKRMAKRLNGTYDQKELNPNEFKVTIKIPEKAPADESAPIQKNDNGGGLLIMVGNSVMGHGPKELGTVLMKGMIYTLTETNPLPKTVIFYNDGIQITTTENDALEDLHTLENNGVEILSCGTCLNYHNVEDQLKVGKITNMYDIFQKIAHASQVVTLE